MSVKIQVVDHNNRAIDRSVKVKIKWTDGISEHYTDSNGYVDTGLKGGIEYIDVYGKQRECGGAWHDDCVITVDY